MSVKDVLDIYNLFNENNISIWIDGGWCVDALLGEQTREHLDLDIAVAKSDSTRLRNLLIRAGYSEVFREDSTEWNYVVTKDTKHVDVHVFEFDEKGNNIYGIEYPKDSLTGTGTINGQKVNCINPEYMFKFKTAYEPKEKDIKDVNALAMKFGYLVPESHVSQK